VGGPGVQHELEAGQGTDPAFYDDQETAAEGKRERGIGTGSLVRRLHGVVLLGQGRDRILFGWETCVRHLSSERVGERYDGHEERQQSNYASRPAFSGQSRLVHLPLLAAIRQKKEAVTPAYAGVTASVYAVNRCRPLRPEFGATSLVMAIQLRAKLDFPCCDLCDHRQPVLDFQPFNFPVAQLGAKFHEP